MQVINIKIIDLHCDTLYRAVTENLGFDSKRLEVSLDTKFEKFLQCYAIWIPDALNPKQATILFDKAYIKLIAECEKHAIKLINSLKEINSLFNTSDNSKLALFTIENCSLLDNDISKIKYLADCGIKIATLTWNDSNCIGDGADVKNPNRITDFGIKAVAEFEKQGIVIDVSHASDKLFFDVCDIANRPFVATHSNSRAITNHRRNLTDEQFKIICSKGGIVGLNFHRDFLNDIPDKASAYDILRHAEHFLSLGGEDNVSIGSDFDGCTLPDDIKGSSSIYEIYELFLKHNYKEAVLNKIFYQNALKFAENFDI